ncbi:MAG TPA: hypothetical protein P5120_04355 [Spirochaetota bacterium]|nr:hypothetical protein [Spirochaetota bacterium]HPF05308.1 hypothetical protein [Spirochaetota bacterium]HPJ41046.1 hypothetical protein [Spirochaetota bacterium]HPR36332.1 hypothetical protein [Spirochaetota bacterium]HRX46729.1 hypothetical protein [Spirochaetota bacterium]
MMFTEKIKTVKENFLNLKNRTGIIYSSYRAKIYNTFELMKKDPREKTRITILIISAVFFIDYIMFSYYVDKNILDIFPSIPVLESKDEINIYIPSEGCKEILSEKRKIDTDVEDNILVKKLVALVAEGSYFENTSSNVPVKLLVKNVWITPDENGGGKICLIDISPVILERNIAIIAGSEQMFRESLEKTVKENVPGITRVILLEKGVPFRKLWEI